jgi:hypothetical protein
VSAGGAPFSRRAAIALAALAAASLAAAALLGTFGDAISDPPTSGPDAFSRSALGHRAYLELLRELGHPVLVSRHRTADRAGDGAVVVVLEPGLGDEDGPREALLEEIEDASARMLLVLPKRTGLPDPTRPRWIATASLVPEKEAQRVLDAIGVDAKVVRPEKAVAGWRGALPAPELDAPQLLRSAVLAPLVETDAGMLAGELVEDGWHLVVLADPDVLATHGLGRGANAALAVALAERLGAPGVPLVADETLHGNEEQPSLARELLRFPLVLATIQALLAAALLAWAALVRFGRPRPPEPLLAAGKVVLVEHTAELLRHGGHVGAAVRAYLRAARDEIAARLRPPGETAAPDTWLVRVAHARGHGRTLRLLEERASRVERLEHGAEREAVLVAQAVHRFREEMTDGAPGDPRRDRTAPG